MRQHERGEIATLLTIGTLVVIGVTAVVSSLFVNQKQGTSSKAACAGCEVNGTCYVYNQKDGAGNMCCEPKQNPRDTACAWNWGTWDTVSKDCHGCGSGAAQCGGKDQPCCKEGKPCNESSLSCQSNTCKEATGGGGTEKGFGTAAECTNNCKVACHQCMQQARAFSSTAVLGASTTYGSKLLAGANLCCYTNDLKTDSGGNTVGCCDPAKGLCTQSQGAKKCNIPNGACPATGFSCNDSPNGTIYKTCVNNMCVYQPCMSGNCTDDCSACGGGGGTGCTQHNCSEVPGHSDYTGNFWVKSGRYYADEHCSQDETDYGIGVWCASIQNGGNNSACKTKSLYTESGCSDVYGTGKCHSCQYGQNGTKWEPNVDPNTLSTCPAQRWQTGNSCSQNCEGKTCGLCNNSGEVLFSCGGGTDNGSQYGTAKCKGELGNTAYCSMDKANHVCNQGDADKENTCGTSQASQPYHCCVPTGDHNGGETPKGDGCSWVSGSTGGGVKAKCTAATGSDKGKCTGTCDGSTLADCKCNVPSDGDNVKRYPGSDPTECNNNCNVACYSCTWDESMQVRANSSPSNVLGISDPLIAAIKGYCCKSPKTGTDNTNGEAPMGDGCSWYTQAMSGKVKSSCGASTSGATCSGTCSGSPKANCKCNTTTDQANPAEERIGDGCSWYTDTTAGKVKSSCVKSTGGGITCGGTCGGYPKDNCKCSTREAGAAESPCTGPASCANNPSKHYYTQNGTNYESISGTTCQTVIPNLDDWCKPALATFCPNPNIPHLPTGVFTVGIYNERNEGGSVDLANMINGEIDSQVRSAVASVQDRNALRSVLNNAVFDGFFNGASAALTSIANGIDTSGLNTISIRVGGYGVNIPCLIYVRGRIETLALNTQLTGIVGSSINIVINAFVSSAVNSICP